VAEPFTEEEGDLIRGIRVDLGVPEMLIATPAQHLEILRRVPQELAEKLVANWQQQSEVSWLCTTQDHEGQIDYLRRGLPVYWPTEPKTIDQTDYRQFAGERGPNDGP